MKGASALVVAAGLAAVGLGNRLSAGGRCGLLPYGVASLDVGGAAVGPALLIRCTARVFPWWAFSEIDVREWGRGALGCRGVLVLGEQLAEHGGEPVGALHMGQVSAIGEQRQPPCGQAVHRGLSLVGG